MRSEDAAAAAHDNRVTRLTGCVIAFLKSNECRVVPWYFTRRAA